MMYLILARLGDLVQQLARHQDEARGAEAALEGGALDERILHRVERVAAFYGLYFLVFSKNSQIKASGDGSAVDQHGAAAAQALSAALARAVEAERVAQHLDQVLVRRHLRRHGLAVQAELDFLPHFFCIAM